MRNPLTVAALSFAVAMPVAAAPPLANVSGFNADLLGGKTCQGTFNTGKHQEGSEGALQLVFAIQGNQLTVDFSRSVGKAGYDAAAYALLKRQPMDAAGYQHLGPAQNFTMSGPEMRFTDPAGGKVALGYQNGKLTGQSDPRGGSDPRMTRLAFVDLWCR